MCLVRLRTFLTSLQDCVFGMDLDLQRLISSYWWVGDCNKIAFIAVTFCV